MDNAKNIPIALVDPPRNPMRMGIDAQSIADLAESIKEVGLISPLVVRPVGERFEVVAGHRRLLACRLAGLAEVPCIVRDISDEQAFGIMGTENLERSDVDPVDEALFLGRFVGGDESKIPAAAKLVNRSSQWVRDRLDILEYPDYMIMAVKRGELKLGVARWVAQVLDEKWRQMFARDAAAQGWTILQAEHQYRLWQCGALEGIQGDLPAPDPIAPKQESRARAICEKCQRLAIDPNLRSVFIHVECPSGDE